MAIILEFRASDDVAPRRKRRRGGSAEIVIFPGVRYERWRERDKRREQAAASVPIRDVLKLVE